MTSPLISIRDVSKTFVVNDERVDALHNVSMTIDRGSFVVIHGHSGSGKSTLLDTIIGLQQPTTGQVFLGENNFYQSSASQRASLRTRFYGVVYQRPNFIASMNVVDNVAFPLLVRGVKRTEARAKARESLERVEMDRFATYDPRLLSGGQQQRVTIARALVADPEVVVADEPTGNLDRTNSNHVLGLLTETHKQLGKTVILVTHDLTFLDIAEHIVTIEDGHVKEKRVNAVGA